MKPTAQFRSQFFECYLNACTQLNKIIAKLLRAYPEHRKAIATNVSSSRELLGTVVDIYQNNPSCPNCNECLLHEMSSFYSFLASLVKQGPVPARHLIPSYIGSQTDILDSLLTLWPFVGSDDGTDRGKS